MQFSSLLTEAGIELRTQAGDAEVTFVCADSRRCGPGGCFVALRGVHQDGHRFLPAVIEAGVAAIVCEDAAAIPASLRDKIPHAVVGDTHQALGCLAQAFHGWPAKKLTCIGITGTNGKSTVAWLIHSILTQANYKTAMLGTITYETIKRSIPASLTTPDAVEIAELMAEMVHAGASHMVMETSSHALDQRRTAGIDFAVAVFTNLSGDHLDYHKTMEDYLAAKCRLFEPLGPQATAVVNGDDAYAEHIASLTKASVRWYGLNPLADLRGRIESIDANGTVFDLISENSMARVNTSLIGRHNVFNCLAAAGACEALGMELLVIAEYLSAASAVPGRLQRVATGGGYQVFVDYAHTDDALANVLGSLRPVTPGRVIVVFGCGGDRDKTKRPRMAKVAQDYADSIFVTSDNPRNEDPQRIIDDIIAGLDSQGRAKTDVQPDRGAAVQKAIESACEGDVVLLAGKGHETYQLVKGQKMHFDDAEVAAECIARREAK
ncbi:MAG: UDP-N-acetylmuramoyl-L-alanyl-D-glutamate--2,6-diaminopimelate ligase [Phycisphaerae bacterium]|nr:UDP-N-acetylmuramoyl-L-alanyl-D-glutamate--2,6-diaminopimelate ligase [Phycisphaerae bacterium]